MLRLIIQFILRHKQLAHVAVYGFGQLFNLVTPLLVVPYIISVCGEDNFGKSAVGMAIAFFLIVFIDYGSDIIGVKEVSVNRDNREQLEKVFWTTYFAKFIVLIGVLLIGVLAFCFIPFFNEEQFLYLFSLSVLVGQFINPTWFLQGIENVKWITYYNILSKLIYLGGIFYTINGVSDYVYINLWWGVGMIISSSLFVITLSIQFGFSFHNINIKASISLLRRDFKMFFSQIFVSLQMYSPIILISYLGNNSMAGQYKIIEQVILIFKTYILLFFNYIYPKVCYVLNKDEKKGLGVWHLFNGVNLIFITVSMAICYFWAEPIVAYFNPNNIELLSELLRVAVFLPLFLALSIPLKQLVLAWDFELYYIKLTSISVIINILMMIMAIPQWGILGVFYSLLITEFGVALFYISCVRKKYSSVR